ncbi:MAG: hypothetical protein ACI9NY_000717 [Kiritimatiellia bacterium]|jgi:hypothetical protein
MKVGLSVSSIYLTFKIIVALLVSAHIIQISIYHLDWADYIKFLDLDIENNLPSFYSAMAIELCAVLLCIIYLDKKQQQLRERWHWLGLAIIFALLGFDETAQLHEEVSDYFTLLVDASGVLYYPWVLPYGIAVAVVGLIYLPWLKRLPTNTQLHFIVAGMIFIAGAIVMEMISATYADTYNTDDWRYSLSYTIEETLEMTGIILFIRALLHYIAATIGHIHFSFTH